VGTDVVTSHGAYRVLGAYMAVTVVTDAIPVAIATRTLDALNFPPRYRWVFPPIKAAAAIGLLSVTRRPALARLTTAMLTLYFVLAVGFHVKARDMSLPAVSAAGFLATFAAMTLKGPPVRA
jgi:hypothetical protein